MEFTAKDAKRTTANGVTIEVQEITFPDHVGDMFLIRKSGEWFRGCGRCGGYGHYSYCREYQTFCFDCAGSGLGVATTAEDAERLVKQRRSVRDRKNRAEFLKAWDVAIEWNAFRSENADVIEFLAGKDGRSGFIGDVAEKAAKFETLTERQCAAIRKIAAEDAGKREKANAAGHFGEVGARYTITAIVTNVKFVDNDFGGSWLITMRGSEGHTFKTFASGSFADVEKNQEVTFKATVKGHGEWNGMAETSLSRCMIPKKK